jgi:hypothetical protein
LTVTGTGVVEADTLSDGWLETLRMVRLQPDHSMFHTFTTIWRPLIEINEVRAACNQLLSDLGLQSVKTVANTIFPSSYATIDTSVSTLSERYLRSYPMIRKLQPHRGDTYFGRLVSYPLTTSPTNQLERLIANLRSELRSSTPKKTRYELLFESPSEQTTGELATQSAIVRAVTDNQIMGFPCLSMCSLQLDQGHMHLLAHYRHEYLVERGYGNYLGLARLLEFVSRQISVPPGRLTVVTGRAEADKALRKTDALFAAVDAQSRTEIAI